MDAILLVLRTGMQWNALNMTGPCSSSSAHRRFQDWERTGVFHEIWRQGLLDYDEVVGIEWDWLAADGATTKAPLGGPKTGPNPTDRAKRGEAFGSHGGRRGPGRARTRGRQPPRPEALSLEPTIESIPVERPEPTEAAPQGLSLDRAYDVPGMHDFARDYGFTPHIRSRGEEIGQAAHSWLAGQALGRRG